MLALIETSEVADLAAPTVLALLLLVVAAGLITGAWYGRAHGLIAIGVLLAFAAVSSTAADVHLRGGVGDREWHPSASTLRDRYSLGVGDAHLDLAAIAPLGGTRRVRAKVGIGQLVVDLPADVDVDVRASTGIGNVDAAGFPRPNSRRDDDVDVVYDSPGTDRLILVLDVGIGHIEVRRAGAFGGVLRLTPIAPVPPIAPTPARAPEVQP